MNIGLSVRSVFGVLVLAGSVVLAACAAGAPAGASAAQSADADGKVCRREIPTGQVIAKRICRTQAEWDKLDKLGIEQRRQAGRDARNPEAE